MKRNQIKVNNRIIEFDLSGYSEDLQRKVNSTAFLGVNKLEDLLYLFPCHTIEAVETAHHKLCEKSE